VGFPAAVSPATNCKADRARFFADAAAMSSGVAPSFSRG
jgi:hypothetical protein